MWVFLRTCLQTSYGPAEVRLLRYDLRTYRKRGGILPVISRFPSTTMFDNLFCLLSSPRPPLAGRHSANAGQRSLHSVSSAVYQCVGNRMSSLPCGFAFQKAQAADKRCRDNHSQYQPPRFESKALGYLVSPAGCLHQQVWFCRTGIPCSATSFMALATCFTPMRRHFVNIPSLPGRPSSGLADTCVLRC